MKNATVYSLALDWTERGYIPDPVIRRSIHGLVKSRLREISADDCEQVALNKQKFIDMMDSSEIAIMTDAANEQHYEIPAVFYEQVLGKHRKYSACYWGDNVTHLDAAEEESLRIYCERAEIHDGQEILELGCGWGSLTLWIAQHYPQSRITAVSNSASQKNYILSKAGDMGLTNINIITCDMNDFDIKRQFDRIVSVEMFEHMHNYRALYSKICGWLKDDGLFFKHIFVHRDCPYEFTVHDESDWMSKYFFSGGIMPSDDLPGFFQEDLSLVRKWRWDGTHYEKTANAWLDNMDKNRIRVMKILENVYGETQADKWWMRWRIFFMACAELFGSHNGQEWWVSHYLFRKHDRKY